MTKNTINVEMVGYTNVEDLSVQCLGVLPQSINGHSSTALVKVVYPNEDYEELFMDLVNRQNHVSHGYKLKLDNVSIGTTYVPWRKMFAGSVVLTVEKEEPVSEVKPKQPKADLAVDSDTPMSPIYLSADGKLLLKPQTLQPAQVDSLTKLSQTDSLTKLSQTDSLTKLSQTDSVYNNASLSNGSSNNGTGNSNNISGILLFALGFVAALGVIGILKRQ